MPGKRIFNRFSHTTVYVHEGWIMIENPCLKTPVFLRQLLTLLSETAIAVNFNSIFHTIPLISAAFSGLVSLKR